MGKDCISWEKAVPVSSNHPEILFTTKKLFMVHGLQISGGWKSLLNDWLGGKSNPNHLITHRFKLDDVSDAYSLMASGKCGKVAVVFDEEIK